MSKCNLTPPLIHDELDQLGVFDAIITTDSHFFINLLGGKVR